MYANHSFALTQSPSIVSITITTVKKQKSTYSVFFHLKFINFCFEGIQQCFPSFLGLRHPTGKKQNLWHPVANP